MQGGPRLARTWRPVKNPVQAVPQIHPWGGQGSSYRSCRCVLGTYGTCLTGSVFPKSRRGRMAFIEKPHHLQRIDTGKLRLRSKKLQKLAVLRMKSSLRTLTKNLEELCEVVLV